jgi:imidazolonepropionase-like amidohydrolase
MSALAAFLLLAATATADPAPCTHISGGTAFLPSGPATGQQVLVAEGLVQAVAPLLEPTWRGQTCQTVELDDERWLTPGLIKLGGPLGLTEVGGEPATRGQDAGGGAPVRAAHRVADSYDPLAVAIPVARREGITAAMVTPTGGIVAGQAAWVRLAGSSQAQAVLDADAALQAGLGGGTPAEGIRLLRELLHDARSYAADPRAYQQNRSRGLVAGHMELEAMGPVIEGRLPLVIGADRAATIEALIRFAEEERVRLVITGGAEAWLQADALAAADIPVVLNPLAFDPSGFAKLHTRKDNAALLVQAGVTVVVSNYDSSFAHHLRQMAGLAWREGMGHSAALEAVTDAPARALGLAGRGRIEPGAAADLVVWTGDPLELSSWASMVLIDGQQQPLRTRHDALFERYRELPGLPLPGLSLPGQGGD